MIIRGLLLLLFLMGVTVPAQASDGHFRPATDVEIEGILTAIVSDHQRIASTGRELCFQAGEWNLEMFESQLAYVNPANVQQGLAQKRDIWGSASQWNVDPGGPSDIAKLIRKLIRTHPDTANRSQADNFIPEGLRCDTVGPAEQKDRQPVEESIAMPAIAGRYAFVSNWYGLFVLRMKEGHWKVDMYWGFVIP